MNVRWREQKEERKAEERRGSEIKERKFRQQELRTLPLVSKQRRKIDKSNREMSGIRGSAWR